MSPDTAAAFSVRRMCAADLEQVIAIAAGLKDAPHWPKSAYTAALNPNSAPRRIALVAVHDFSGDIAGFSVISLLPPQAELESIAVRANGQRQGIGSKLMGWLAEELKAAAVSEICLELRASNESGLAFYQSLGWRQFGLRPRYYADPEEDAILMSLSVV